MSQAGENHRIDHFDGRITLFVVSFSMSWRTLGIVLRLSSMITVLVLIVGLPSLLTIPIVGHLLSIPGLVMIDGFRSSHGT